MRIVVPVLEKDGVNSEISPHFGRAPFLAVLEVSEGSVESIDFVAGEGPHDEHRSEEEKAKASSIHDRIIEIMPDAIVAQRIGPGAVRAFSSAGIKILHIDGSTISEILPKIG